MKILQIIDTLEIGGAEKLSVTLAQQAHAKNIDLSIISLRNSKGKFDFTPQLEKLDAKVVFYPAPKLFTISRLRAITKFIKKEDFSIIHTHLTYANIIGGIIGKLLGIPVISTLHSTANATRHIHFLRDKTEIWILRLATKVLGVGEKVSEIFQPILGREITTLPNAVDENSGLPPLEREMLRARFGLDSAQPVFISVGRLVPDKAHADLLTAFKIITKKIPAAKLLIVGEGYLESELEEKSKTLGLEESVRWLGARDDVPNLLAISDIYISASRREGLSLSLLEAMMASLPMAVTDVGETSLLVSNDAGILVSHNNPEELAKAALEILAMPNYGRKLGKAGLARARTEYGAEQWFLRLMEIYEEITPTVQEQDEIHA